VSTWTYALTECRALALYLKLALWPQPLVFDYGWAFVRHAATIWPQALVVGALLTATTLALWRRPVAGFIGGWFFVVLAPTSSFVPVLHQPIAESRMYLPLAGLIAGGVAAAHLAASRRVNAPRLAVLVALALLVLARNAIYRDPLTLWRDTLAKQPLNARAHNNLASTLLDLKRHAEALPHALEAARLQPRYADAQVNIGAALAAAGRIAEAAEHYRTAIAFDPNYATGHANLGNALLLLGRPAEAQPHLETAIHLNPDLAQPHNDLGVLLLDAGRYEDSLVHEEIAVRLAPNEPNGHYNLGNACARLRRYPEAIAAYQNALRLKPDFAKAHNNLGVVLLLSGRAAEAVPCFEAALRYNPSHPEAPRNLEAARRAAQR
jgi:tetratricopeptide (TPR) repeat protein